MKHLDLKKGIILITYGILLTMVIIKWDFFSGMFSNVSGLLAPFIYGLVLAFLVYPFGLPAIGGWLLERLYGVKYALQDFMVS